MDKYVVERDISYEMKNRYPVYALSVIKDRALPDVRDGMKPVTRRIAYAMYLLKLNPDKSYRKCARIVGDVLGKYHPHGDSSVYDALVRLAQDFSMRYILVDGHGNFGSVDGDGSAAMRYTEARMSKIMLELLKDIDKNVVDFKPNFDGEELEPIVLPSRYPNILVNGSSGIAVGMATNIPPHNLGEVIDGCIAYIDDNNISIENLVRFIQAPDFPTGGAIVNCEDLLDIYKAGAGKILIRSKYHIEHEDGKKQIVFTEIPYQVNKSKICSSIAELSNKKDVVLKNILDVRDESDREGMRIVVELKEKDDENIIIAYLFKKTKLQTTFSCNFNVLVNEAPMVLNLKDIIKYYIEFQQDVITRRTIFDKNKINKRLPIIDALVSAINNIDDTIKLIKTSKNKSEANDKLKGFLNINQEQAEAILKLELQRLTTLDKDNLKKEQMELRDRLKKLELILSDKAELNNVLKTELLQIKETHNDIRRTELLKNCEAVDISIKKEDIIEDYLVTMIYTKENYTKKTRKYSEQQTVKDNDEVVTILQCSNKDKAMYITDKGNLYFLNIWEMNDKLPSKLGDYLPSLLTLEKDEIVIGMITTNDYKGHVLIAFSDGHVVKIPMTSYYTKTNRTKLSNCLSDRGKPILITQIEEDCDLELTNSFGKTIKINTKDINEKKSRNSNGITVMSSKRKGFEVTKAIKI